MGHYFLDTRYTMLPSRNSRYWNQWSADLRLAERDWLLKRCIHYYACICAFASDQKLRDEFRWSLFPSIYMLLFCALSSYAI